MIGKYYTYKCKKCGYVFTKYQSDVFFPVICPKCGGDVEIISSSLFRNSLLEIFSKIKNLVK